MARPTQLIYSDNPGGLPASYAVPGGLEIVVSSIFARFDGTGAAGDFYPCLDILSQDNKLISRVPIEETLTTGDLARCTWAPFLRRRAASAAGFVPSYAFCSYTGGAVAGNATINPVPLNAATFQTSDATMFPGVVANLISAPTSNGLLIINRLRLSTSPADGTWGITTTGTPFDTWGNILAGQVTVSIGGPVTFAVSVIAAGSLGAVISRVGAAGAQSYTGDITVWNLIP